MTKKRLIYPGRRADSPQYVLGTRNGTIRTSNVTEEKIYDAVYDIEEHESVYLEKCEPVVLVRYAEAYSIDYYKDGSIAVCFRVNGYMFRMWRSGVGNDVATDIFCGFFRSATLPDMTGWQCQKIYPEQEKEEDKLTVDGEDFRYFSCPDIVGALENIIEGKSRSMLYVFTKENGGYVNIHRRNIEDTYGVGFKVEYVMWTEQDPIGYRGVTSDAKLLREWLWHLIDDDRLPDSLPEWKQFDVNDHFERLVFRFLDEEKEDERKI